uniref:ubiquitinyl hydrolase 1 n=1 Tax=Tetraodon nigroviridis TaxID=99883 RepID=H3BXL5_TETNG
QMEAFVLVSCKKDISTLFPEEAPSSKEKQEISSQFSHVRTICGDGNCLYRAVFFAYLESMIHNDMALAGFKTKTVNMGSEFFIAGLEEDYFIHHLDTVVELVDSCQSLREEALLRLFNQPEFSDSVVQYLRLLASVHLQNNADFFCNFVEAPNLQLYCQHEVERMAREGGHVEIIALTQALDMSIHIVNMNVQQEHLVHHVIPEGGEPSLHLLYQSAHYNILYPRPKA